MFCHVLCIIGKVTISLTKMSFLYTHPLVFGENICHVLSIKNILAFATYNIRYISHQHSSLHIQIPVSDIKDHKMRQIIKIFTYYFS